MDDHESVPVGLAHVDTDRRASGAHLGMLGDDGLGLQAVFRLVLQVSEREFLVGRPHLKQLLERTGSLIIKHSFRSPT